jgi:hypothetical protein
MPKNRKLKKMKKVMLSVILHHLDLKRSVEEIM